MAIKTVRNLPVGHGDVSWVMNVTGIAQPYICTMSFNFTTAPNSTVMLDLQDAFGDTLMPIVNGGLSLTNAHAFFKVDATNDQTFDAFGPTIVGTGGAVASGLSINCALLIRKHTQFAGRRNTGRMYLPGMVEGNVDAFGVVLSTHVTAANLAVAAFFTRVAQYNPEIVHSTQYEEGVDPVPPTPPAPTPVTALSVDNVVGSQRRRLHR